MNSWQCSQLSHLQCKRALAQAIKMPRSSGQALPQPCPGGCGAILPSCLPSCSSQGFLRSSSCLVEKGKHTFQEGRYDEIQSNGARNTTNFVNVHIWLWNSELFHCSTLLPLPFHQATWTHNGGCHDRTSPEPTRSCATASVLQLPVAQCHRHWQEACLCHLGKSVEMTNCLGILLVLITGWCWKWKTLGQVRAGPNQQANFHIWQSGNSVSCQIYTKLCLMQPFQL